MANKGWFSSTIINSPCNCKIVDKEASQRAYIGVMFDRTAQMFEYENLPETIPAYMLETYLQMLGHVCVTEVNGNLYALPGNFGGAPDPYFRPTLYVVANPGLNFSASLSIVNYLPPYGIQDNQGKCVLLKNDTNMEGLFTIASRYAQQLSENDISIRCAQINARYQTFISASTDSEIKAANEYLKGVEDGKTVAVAEAAFLDGVKVANVSQNSSNAIIQLIELQQYLKASWFNEIGLNANFNMKREYLSAEEVKTSSDILLPLVDDMLKRRRESVDLVNETYGTNITVKKNSSWEKKQAISDIAIEQSVADVEATREDGDNEDIKRDISEVGE